MKHTVFIQALAEAFLREVSAEEQSRILEEMDAFQEVWRTSPVLRDTLLGSESLSKRVEILQGLLAKKFATATQNLLSLLLRERALSALSLFLDQARRLRIERGLGREVTVISAHPLSAELRERLTQGLVKQWQMPIHLSEKIEPEVIGGLRLESGDWSWDATMQHRLERLIQHLRVS